MIEAREAEAAVLGAALLATEAVDVLASELRLKPEHFALPSHRAIWQAMLDLRDRDEAVDSLTVGTTLNGKVDRSVILGLESTVPSAGHFREYARTVIAEADWRRVEAASHMLQTAIRDRDEEKRQEAERALQAPSAEVEALTFNPDRLADEFWDYIQDRPETFQFPFGRLNYLTSGGLRRGGVTLIGGWTGDGKTAWLDQVLEHIARHGTRVHLFINEMTRIERVARTVARITGIPSSLLVQGKLNIDQRASLGRALSRLPFGITECGDLQVDDVARMIRRGHWDVVGVDILHLFEHREERDLARISRVLNRAAKASGAHLLVTVHLNEHRAHTQALPPPALGDIRGSGMLKNDADQVMFVYLQREEGGETLHDGSIYLRKTRHGTTGGMAVRFNGQRMRFEALDESR